MQSKEMTASSYTVVVTVFRKAYYVYYLFHSGTHVSSVQTPTLTVELHPKPTPALVVTPAL